MKIFTAAQIKACDAYTIHTSGITSSALMERTASACADWLTTHLPAGALFIVLCGTGNNGGDGLAIARLLHQQGFGVKAFLLQFRDHLSPDCQHNLEWLQSIDNDLVTTLAPDTFIADVPPNVVLLDAILGTGLSRPPEGWLANFIGHINQLPNRKIAIDIPSGLPADTIPAKGSAILQAHHTLSFQFYKRTFLHTETGGFAGNIHILDIGLSKAFIESTHVQYFTSDDDHIKQIYKPRNAFSHKGTYGSALMIGGSYGKMGAITLSSKAALHAGAGTVTSLVPDCGYSIIQTAAPEVMCRVSGKKHIEKIDEWEKMKAIGIGPGLDTEAVTAKALAAFIDVCKQPIVVDADALNLISKQPELLAKLPAGSILTPHPKEFSRLFGNSTDSMQQLELARAQAMRYNIFIVLKGHHTAIVTPEGDCFYNLTGNAGMATGGAGDVLTGIVTGLLAQSYQPSDAAILGVYLHGKAGDIAAARLSQEALTAGDIVNHLGQAFLYVKQLQEA